MIYKWFFLSWCTLVTQGAIGMDGAGPASTGPKTLKEYAAARCARLEFGLRPTDTIPQELIEVLQEHPVNVLQQWGESFLRACSRAPEGANVSSAEQIGEINTVFSQLNVLLDYPERKVLERLARVQGAMPRLQGWHKEIPRQGMSEGYEIPMYLERNLTNLSLVNEVFLNDHLEPLLFNVNDVSELLQFVWKHLKYRFKFIKIAGDFQQDSFIGAVNELAVTLDQCARKSELLRTLLSHRVDFLREIVAMNAMVCNGQEVPAERIQRTPYAYIVAGGVQLSTMSEEVKHSLSRGFFELWGLEFLSREGKSVLLYKMLRNNTQHPVHTLNTLLSYSELLQEISKVNKCFYDAMQITALYEQCLLICHTRLLAFALLPISDNLTQIINAIDTHRVDIEEELFKSRIRLLCELLKNNLLPQLHRLNNAFSNKDCTELLERIERLNTTLSGLAGDDRERGWWTEIVINSFRKYGFNIIDLRGSRPPFAGRPAGRK